MLRALRTAALGMSAQQMSVDNTANNLANANTTGFKRNRVAFQDLLYQRVRAAGGEDGAAPPARLQMGHGAIAVATVGTFTQGGLTETGNALDMAVNGSGFFAVQMPDGSRAYTRDGAFTLTAEGLIVTQSGFTLDPGIEVPPDSLELQIQPDGTVRALLPGEPEPTELGQLELARFQNPAGLRNMGGNLFAETEGSGTPVVAPPGQDGIGTVQQGLLEASNVDVVQEMVDLIASQRAYELNSKMVQAGEEMLQIANGVKR
ncbi:flagellar basal-body rod protein FlgG [Rubrivirga sp.]|uniref:flagellar basal-body rod protein FlgG n=1 Tax=Rubrivirga sp. TaxID=1885344 RepID=UPI003C720457